MGQRGWFAALATFAAIRVSIPLAALAASGSALPGLPRYEYVGLTGDATGFYAAAREFLASWGRLPSALLLVLVAASLGAAGILIWAWPRRPAWRPWLVAGVAAVFAVVVSAAVTEMHPPGA